MMMTKMIVMMMSSFICRLVNLAARSNRGQSRDCSGQAEAEAPSLLHKDAHCSKNLAHSTQPKTICQSC